jgi:hypothetical protein
MSPTPTDLQDAEPEAWRGEKLPDLSPELLALCAAYDRLKEAQAAVDGHPPPYAGPAWTATTRAYAEAKTELFRTFERIKGGSK